MVDDRCGIWLVSMATTLGVCACYIVLNTLFRFLVQLKEWYSVEYDNMEVDGGYHGNQLVSMATS